MLELQGVFATRKMDLTLICREIDWLVGCWSHDRLSLSARNPPENRCEADQIETHPLVSFSHLQLYHYTTCSVRTLREKETHSWWQTNFSRQTGISIWRGNIFIMYSLISKQKNAHNSTLPLLYWICISGHALLDTLAKLHSGFSLQGIAKIQQQLRESKIN